VGGKICNETQLSVIICKKMLLKKNFYKWRQIADYVTDYKTGHANPLSKSKLNFLKIVPKQDNFYLFTYLDSGTV
jgi:hypothetical protein